MSAAPAESRPGTVRPLDGSPIDAVAWSTPDEVRAIVAGCRAAQPAWAGRTVDERGRLLVALGRRIAERRDEAIAHLRDELGRGEGESLMSELAYIVSYAKAAVAEGKAALAPRKVSLSALEYPGKKATVELLPRGVIAVIAPWNLPLLQFYRHVFPALLAGNAVVMKPSEFTPRTSGWLHAVCAEVLPEGLVGLVQGDGSVGAALLGAGIDAATFTGSPATGKKVAARCAELGIPLSLELGSADAAIVLDDCDLDRTVAGVAFMSMQNAGQDCSSIERVYATPGVADELVRRLGRVCGALRVATADQPGEIGPLANARQLAIVEDHVRDALAKGAVLVTGGERVGTGFGYRPTVLDRCTDEMKVVQEETFGPVVAVVRVADPEEAVRRANAAPFGLCGSVWTGDVGRGEAIARRLEVGTAFVNNHSFTGTVASLPWTGTKGAGTGVGGSRHSYGNYTRIRTVLVDRNKKPELYWYPANDDLVTVGHAVAKLGLGAFGQVFTLLPLLSKRVKAIAAFTRDAPAAK